MRISPMLRLTLAVAAALAVGGCDWVQKKAPPNEKRLAAIARARSKLVHNACASAMAYERLTKLAFDEAIRIRNADPVNLATLAAHTVVRMEDPLVKSRDDKLNVTVCTGRFILELPPGAERGFGGELRLVANVEYAAQPAADGDGLVYQLRGAEPIVYKLAAFDLRAEPYRSGRADDPTRFAWVPDEEMRTGPGPEIADSDALAIADGAVQPSGSQQQVVGARRAALQPTVLPVPPVGSDKQKTIRSMQPTVGAAKPKQERSAAVRDRKAEAPQAAGRASRSKQPPVRQESSKSKAVATRQASAQSGAKALKLRQAKAEPTKATRVRSAKAEPKQAVGKKAANVRLASARPTSKAGLKTKAKAVREARANAGTPAGPKPKSAGVRQARADRDAKAKLVREARAGGKVKNKPVREAKAESKRKPLKTLQARGAPKKETLVRQAQLAAKPKTSRMEQVKAELRKLVTQAKAEPRVGKAPVRQARVDAQPKPKTPPVQQGKAEAKPKAPPVRKAEAAEKQERVRQAEAARRPPIQRALQTSVSPRPAVAVSRFRPSFNCRFARSRSEQMICSSQQLAALDRTAASLFSSAVSDADGWTRSELARTRSRFLAYRERCTSESCVANAYRGRMEEIKDIMAQRY